MSRRPVLLKRIARQHGGQVEQRRRGRLARRLGAQLLQVVARRGGLGLIAHPALQLGDLGRDLPVRRIELAGAAVLAQRFVELPAHLERCAPASRCCCDALSIARSSAILYSALFGLLPAPRGGSARPPCPSRRPWRRLRRVPNERPAPQPGGQHGHAQQQRKDSHTRVCEGIIVLRVESSAVRVRRVGEFDGVGADAQHAVTAFDDIAFPAVHQAAAPVAEERDAARAAAPRSSR